MKSKFQMQLEKLVLHKIIILIIFGFLSFGVCILSLNYYTNESNSQRNLDNLIRSLESCYGENEAFLWDETVHDEMVSLLNHKQNAQQFDLVFNRLSDKFTVSSHIILTNAQGDVMFTSFEQGDMDTYRINYTNAVNFHSTTHDVDEIYRSLFYRKGYFSEVMFSKPIYENQVLLGYATMFLSGSDWNLVLSDSSYDGIIIDDQDNILYCSKSSFMGSVGKFSMEDTSYLTFNDQRYWVKTVVHPQYDVTIYSLVYAPPNQNWLIGLGFLIFAGLAWFTLAKSMSASMAQYNAKSVRELVSEIHIVQSGNIQYRMETQRQNEFDDIARQINSMLDATSALNQKNIELLNLNNKIELDQLTAQINPHFLYNTLAMIQALVHWEPQTAANLIEKLTAVLRYSIDRSRQEVRVDEDLAFIQDYLDIQQKRFGENLTVDMNIEPACFSCTVQKLILQPMIENSIKYGFQHSMTIHLELKGYLRGDMLYLEVNDDGPGLSDDKLQDLNKAIRKKYDDSKSNGLHNISRRLLLQYGKDSGIVLSHNQPKGLSIVVKIQQRKGLLDV